MNIINNIVDNNLMLNWSGCVRRFEKKFAECDNIFLQNFSVDSIAYIYLLVQFLFCLLFCFFSCLFATIYGEYRCIFTSAERYYSLASTRADILRLSINRQQYECVNNLPSVGVSWITAKIVPAVTQSFVEYTVRTIQRNRPKITQ